MASLFGNMIANLLGLFTFRGLYLRNLSRRIRAIAGEKKCLRCDHSLDSRPRVYSSSDYPTKRPLRNPSVIAEFHCSVCGGRTEFLYRDDDTLTLISEETALRKGPAK